MQFDIKEPDSVNLKKNQENWQKLCKSCPRIVQIWNEFSKNSLILIKISNISFLNWIMTLQNSFLNWITCVVKIWFTRKTFLIRISFLFSSFLNRILTVFRKALTMRLKDTINILIILLRILECSELKVVVFYINHHCNWQCTIVHNFELLCSILASF